MPPMPNNRARMAFTLASPACSVEVNAVTNSNNTVNAHGLIPSTTPAASTVGSVICGRYFCIASTGALGCQSPVRAIAPRATRLKMEMMVIERRRRLMRLCLDNQLALHRRIRTPATADVAVVGVRAGLIGCEGRGVVTLCRCDYT